jgi:hypothetical protein
MAFFTDRPKRARFTSSTPSDEENDAIFNLTFANRPSFGKIVQQTTSSDERSDDSNSSDKEFTNPGKKALQDIYNNHENVL